MINNRKVGNLSYEELSKLVEDSIFNQQDNKNYLVATGKGGVYDYVRALNKKFNQKNPDTVTFRQLRAVFKHGWIRKEGGYYIIN